MAARKGHRPSKAPAGRPRFWGKHAVGAALANPERTVRKIMGTREALAGFDLPAAVPVTFAEATDLARLVPGDAPHQGVVIEVEPLEDMWLADLLEHGKDDNRPLVILDGVTDPHNVGAILRSAAAFDALGIVTPDRNAPPESGTIARAASGALETVPWIRVVNLARALEEIAEAGFWRIGLTGHATQTCPRRWARSASRSCSVPRAKACARTPRITATNSPSSPSRKRSRASTSRTPRRSHSTR